MRMNGKSNFKVLLIAFLLIAVLILYLTNYPVEEKTLKLSELQTVACEVADGAGTCDSRLPDLGIVLQEECCQALGKCCGDGN